MHINGIEETGRGPSFWKFNSSLLEDDEYITLITEKYNTWLEEGKDIQDPRVLWVSLSTKSVMKALPIVNRRPEIEGRNC